MELSACFASLVRHHVATEACPLPPAQPGITWIWAANGIWKRGVSETLDLLIPVGMSWHAPGLARMLPHARFRDLFGRLPGAALAPLLQHAQQATDGRTIARPIEQQYFITYRADRPWKPIRVAVPSQQASAGHVTYQTGVPGRILVDVHSHHQMAAYFSGTDDRDDTGLSVSAVIGQIYTCPTIVVRLNVYGHRWRVPAGLVFDHLGPFVEPVWEEEPDAIAVA